MLAYPREAASVNVTCPSVYLVADQIDDRTRR